jgi:Asp-tRNA(Asn)/Glu-tRNA(Gln) amidotransferase B subunit
MRSQDRPVQEIVKAYQPLREDGARVTTVVKEVVQRAGELEGRSPDVLLRWAVGEVMRSLFGRVDPLKIRRRLARVLGVGSEEEVR